MTEVALSINGTDYTDFVECEVSFGVEQFAREFRLSYSDKHFHTGRIDLPFVEGDPCELKIGDQVVLDGFIDDVPIRYTSNEHRIDVYGRSWTGHLVDCSAIYKAGSWKDVKLEDIIIGITEPFDVGVVIGSSVPADAAGAKFRRFAIEEEESAVDAIARACKMRGVFPTSDEGRFVVVTRAGQVDSGETLELGKNVLTGERLGKWRDRYSQYIVKAQTAGDNIWNGAKASRVSFRAVDPQVTAYRPLVIVADGPATKDELDFRGNWEMSTRAGRSQRLTYTVVGATKSDGALWAANETVRVIDPFLGIDDQAFLIYMVSISVSAAGTVTTLQLGHPEALDVLPPKPKKKRKAAVFEY